MSGWRFALSKRWAGYFALTVVFAIVCSLLGMWQFARRAEARAEIDRVESNYSSEPVDVRAVLTELDSWSLADKWTPVVLEGEYLVDEQLLARNRPFSGQPGFEVLVPFRLDDGTVLIVDRGWVPIGNEQDAPDVVPPAPTGPVTVVARLKAGEPTFENRTAPPGQIASIDLQTIADSLGQPTYTGAYGLLASEDPAPATAPLLPAKPTPDEGPHLSYALQWFVFAIIGFFGFGWALRQEYRAINIDDPDERERALARARKAAARKPTDDEIEDALLDDRVR